MPKRNAGVDLLLFYSPSLTSSRPSVRVCVIIPLNRETGGQWRVGVLERNVMNWINTRLSPDGTMWRVSLPTCPCVFFSCLLSNFQSCYLNAHLITFCFGESSPLTLLTSWPARHGILLTHYTLAQCHWPTNCSFEIPVEGLRWWGEWTNEESEFSLSRCHVISVFKLLVVKVPAGLRGTQKGS